MTDQEQIKEVIVESRSFLDSIHAKATILLVFLMLGMGVMVFHQQSKLAALQAKLDVVKVESDSKSIDTQITELMSDNKDLQTKIINQEKELKKIRAKIRKDKPKQASDDEVIKFWENK